MNLDQRRSLWELVRGMRGLYLCAIAAMAAAIGTSFLTPLIVMSAIDGIVGGGDGELSWLARRLAHASEAWGPLRALLAAALGIVAFQVLAGTFEYFHGRWSALASERLTRDLRERLHARLKRLSCTYHDRADNGDLVQRCTSDVETVRVFLSQQVVAIARAVLYVGILVPILFWLHVRMALVSLALFPLIVVFALVFFRRVKQVFEDVEKAEGRMTSVLQENLTGVRVVRAFARQEFECEKFGSANAAFRDRDYRLIRLLGSYWALSDVLCLAQLGLVIFAGAVWTVAGEMSVGELVAFYTFEGMVIWPVRHMGRVLSDTGKAIVALGRIGEIFEVPLEDAQDEVLHEDALPRVAHGNLDVEGLEHAYADGTPVLRGISFQVKAGETLALLGPPGSGKSTIAHLLMRLYDYDAGSIRLDGREIAELPRRWVRSQVAAVLQEPFLLSKTIRQNLALGRPAASHDELVHAAATAAVHESIEGFGDGYDTLVGERGVTLSGGQRQRVALARALLKHAPLLILDDSLSAVDTDTETRILGALRERRGKQTTIVVAHRLSSVRDADRILVLDAGRVVQSGSHDELLREEGPYQRLWAIQGALEDELERDLDAARSNGLETVMPGGSP